MQRVSTVEIGARKNASRSGVLRCDSFDEPDDKPPILETPKKNVSMEDDSTWMRAKQLKKKEMIKVVAKQEIDQSLFKPFPHPYEALFTDFLGWAERGVYFILHNREGKDGRDYRHFHRDCLGTHSSKTSKLEMINESQEYPVLILDLSNYPILAEEGEWDAHLQRVYPNYVMCTCPYAKYVLHGKDINRLYYRLDRPYFYLTGLNQEGDDCFRTTKLAKPKLD